MKTVWIVIKTLDDRRFVISEIGQNDEDARRAGERRMRVIFNDGYTHRGEMCIHHYPPHSILKCEVRLNEPGFFIAPEEWVSEPAPHTPTVEIKDGTTVKTPIPPTDIHEPPPPKGWWRSLIGA